MRHAHFAAGLNLPGGSARETQRRNVHRVGEELRARLVLRTETPAETRRALCIAKGPIDRAIRCFRARASGGHRANHLPSNSHVPGSLGFLATPERSQETG